MDESTCPYCAEPIDRDALKCKSCGERQGVVEVSPRPSSARTVIVVVLIVFFFAGLAACILPYILLATTRGAAGGGGTVVAAAPALPPDPGQATPAQIQSLANNTMWSSTMSGGDLSVPCSVYSWGGYALIDIGSVRIAVRGVRFTGHVGSSVIIQHAGFGGSSGNTTAGIGAHSFNTSTRNGVTTCNFDKLGFTIQNGNITLTKSGAQLPVQGGRQVVFVDADGSNAKVLPYTGP